jgi:hypothetical protein
MSRCECTRAAHREVLAFHWNEEAAIQLATHGPHRLLDDTKVHEVAVTSNGPAYSHLQRAENPIVGHSAMQLTATLAAECAQRDGASRHHEGTRTAAV